MCQELRAGSGQDFQCLAYPSILYLDIYVLPINMFQLDNEVVFQLLGHLIGSNSPLRVAPPLSLFYPTLDPPHTHTHPSLWLPQVLNQGLSHQCTCFSYMRGAGALT